MGYSFDEETVDSTKLLAELIVLPHFLHFLVFTNINNKHCLNTSVIVSGFLGFIALIK